MDFVPNHFYHVYNRGNNGQSIFYDRQNYLYFLKKMKNHLKPYSHVLAYCLMPNHFHWLLYIPNNTDLTANSLNKAIGTLLSSYTKAINKKYDRTGSLFQQRTKAVAIDSKNYIITCFHYIHRNPIEAGLVQLPKQWLFSSYRDYTETRNSNLINKAFALQTLDIDIQTIKKQTSQTIKKEKIAEFV